MVTLIRPDWFEEWVNVDEKGWHLKDNAPDKIKKEFEEYMQEINEGTIEFE